MIKVMAGDLRKGDVFQVSEDSIRSYTVTGRRVDDDSHLFVLELAEHGPLTLPRDTILCATTMYRLARVPCLVHKEDVELLYDRASGGTPRAVICGQCDEKVTAEVMRMAAGKKEKDAPRPEPQVRDKVVTEQGQYTIDGFSDDYGTRLSSGEWVCASRFEYLAANVWKLGPVKEEVD